MKLYVAGTTREKGRVRRVMNDLRRRGHYITHDWTGEQIQWRDEPPGYGAALAQEERDGVKNAEGLVLLMPRSDGSALDEGKEPKILKGAWIDFGAAAFDGKPCVVVSETGGMDSLFCCLPNVDSTPHDVNAHSVLSELARSLRR